MWDLKIYKRCLTILTLYLGKDFIVVGTSLRNDHGKNYCKPGTLGYLCTIVYRVVENFTVLERARERNNKLLPLNFS